MKPVDPTGREKRITFQLYDYWFELADDHDIPPLKSLKPEDIASYKNNMVLIDLRAPDKEPTLQVIGPLLCQDLGQDLTHRGVSEIPRPSLLSHIIDHYGDVLTNKSPVSFDTDFENNAREKFLCRGILMPFSDDGEVINFILGAIRWTRKEELPASEEQDDPDMLAASISIEADPAGDRQDKIDAGALLQVHLENCRKLVQGQNPAEIRSRKSLYEALGAILDFHDLCVSNPESYGDLLQAEGLKTQSRAPFTPTLKLCFGRDYDKTRLTEYAAALSYARKNNQDGTSLPGFLENFPGGIKGCVRAERAERNMTSGGPSVANTVKDLLEESQKIIHKMPSVAVFDIGEDIEINNDLCLLLGRRDGSRIEVIKILQEDEKVLALILKRVAKDP